MKRNQRLAATAYSLLAALVLIAASSGAALSATDAAQKGPGPGNSGQVSPDAGQARTNAANIDLVRGGPDIVIIDDIDFVPNPDFTGGSILWVDGSTCDCDVTPFNLNVYGSPTTVQFFWPNNANGSEGGVSLDGGTTYAVLDVGDTIGPASDFLVITASAATAPWSAPGNVDGYLGFRFLDDGITKYGYAYITTGASGRPFTIHSLAYNDVGDPITITLGMEYNVGGTVSGFVGSGLVLQNNGNDDLAIAADGPFTFATPLDDGETYDVTVLTQPDSPSQTCSVTNGSGTISGADVDDIEVSCVTDTFAVGGTVVGLAVGNSVVLQNNGADDLTIGANGAFVFDTEIEDGEAYSVTVLTQPAGQTCVVSNGSGTISGAEVDDILVDCTTTELGISPTSLDLGIVNPNETNTGVLTLTNTGTGPVEVSSISGPSAPFELTGGTCPSPSFTLASGENCTLTIEFTPTAPGSFDSTLEIESDAGQISVFISGASRPSPLAVPAIGPIGLALMIMALLLIGLRMSRRFNTA